MKRLMKRIAPVFYAVCMVFTSMATPILTLPVHAADANDSKVVSETDTPVVKDDSSNADTKVPEEQPPVKEEDSQPADENSDATVKEETNENTAAPNTGDANTNDAAQNLLGGGTSREITLTVNVNGESKPADSLRGALSGMTMSTITSIEFVSGKVTAADLSYLNSLKYQLTKMETLSIDLDSDLTYVDGAGAVSTILPADALSSMSKVKTLSLKGFTQLGQNSLKGMMALTTAKIPDVTVIGKNAFNGCSALSGLDLSQVQEIGENAFSGCKALNSINISKVKNVGNGAFNGCSGLTSLDLTGVETVGVNAFNGCSGLTSVNLANVKEFGSSAFQGCSKLTSVTLPSGLTEIAASMFKGCTKLAAIDLTNIKTIGIYGFQNCGALTKVDAPNLEKMESYAFANCGALTSVNIPKVAAIGDYAFSSCKKLTGMDFSNVRTIGMNAFDSCSGFKELNLKGVESIGNAAFTSCTNLEKLDITGVKNIENNAFARVATVLQITCDSAEAPVCGNSVFPNVKAGTVINVPAGSLPNYLTDSGKANIGSLVSSEADVKWQSKVEINDPDYVTIMYTEPDSVRYPVNRYQVLKKGDAIGNDPFDHNKIFKNSYRLGGWSTASGEKVTAAFVPEESMKLYGEWVQIKVSVADKDGNVVKTIDLPTNSYNKLDSLYPELPAGAKQWNTEKDGSGQTVLSTTKLWNDTTIYPIFEDIVNVSVKVNGSEAALSGANLALTIANAGVDAKTMTSLEIVSGKMTVDDFEWMRDNIMASGSALERFIIAEGVDVENKQLPTIALYSNKLNYLELHGIETIGAAALNNSVLETVILPDVKVIGGNGLGLNNNITKLEIPNIEELGSRCFDGQKQLASVNCPNLKVIGEACFANCDNLTLNVNQLPKVGTNGFNKSTVVLNVPVQVYVDYYRANGTNVYEGATLKTEAANVINVNGTDYTAIDLQDAVVQSGAAVADITSLKFVSGSVTQSDLAYLKELTELADFEMNVGEGLTLIGKDGNPTTVLSKDTAVIEFAPQPSNSSKPNIRTAVLGGITEIQEGALIGNSLEQISLPNAVTVGDSAFFGFPWLEKLDLSGAKTIGKNAFQRCTRLTSLTLNAVEKLGEGSFKYTDSLRNLTLPETIKNIENIGFGTTLSGNKSGTEITINAMTPPVVASGAFKGVSSTTTRQAKVIVPQGALDAYLKQIDPQSDVTKVLKLGKTNWNGLYLRETGTNRVEFYSPNSWEVQYAFVKAGEALTEDQIATLKMDGKVLTGWNTAKDGSGETVAAGYIPTELNNGELVVYPQFRDREEILTAIVDGTSYTGESLEDIIVTNKLNPEAIISLKLESGVVTQEDLSYLKSLTELENFEMNVGENLVLTGKDGNPTTVLSKDTAVIEFAPQPSNSSKPNIRTAVLGGITEIQEGALIGNSLEQVSLPNAVTVGDSAFFGFPWLEKLDLSGAKTIGKNAFQGCTRLTSLTLNAVEKLGEGSFKYTDSLKKLTLPETIKNIENIGFGRTFSGNKSGTVITINALTPPVVEKGAFTGVSSLTTQAKVVVPQGALDAYLKQIDPQSDVTKVLKLGKTNWNGLYLRETGTNRVEFYSPNSWEVQYAFVKAGEALTEDQIAVLAKEGYVLTGWNTAKDGTGEEVKAGYIPAKEMTVYPQYRERVERLTATIDGNTYTGESLQDIIVTNKLTPENVLSVKLEKGSVMAEDLAYLESLTRLKDFEMNIGTDLTLIGADGKQTTVLSKETAVVKFAPARKGSSKPDIRNIVLGGITEIQSGGLSGSSAEVISMPDVITVGDSAFAFKFPWLEKLDLSNARTIGNNAFAECQRLRELTMNKVETLGKGSFYYTDNLTRLTLPSTIKDIQDIEFGKVGNGNKSGTKVILNAVIPPACDSGAFHGVSSISRESTVTVPQGSLDAYVKQQNAMADASKVLARKDTIWNDLYLREAGSYRVEFYSQNSWEVQYSFVKAGNALTEDQIAVLKKDGHILTGWNTKKDGTGEAVTAGFVPEQEMTVYPIFKEAAIVTYSVDGQETPVEVVKGEAIGELPADPVKEGYTFKGWNTKADGTGEVVTAETVVNENMTVYAIFEENAPATATVTFNVDGTETTVDVVIGDAIGDRLPEDPTKEGHIFKGWNTAADGTGEAVTAETVVSENMTVYAVFEKEPEVVIPAEMGTVKVENGKVTITLKDKPTTPPTLEDFKLQMNLNGNGNKDVEITGFTYDGDKTVVLTFKKVEKTAKTQKFTMTVSMGEQSVTSGEITVPAKDKVVDKDKTNDKNKNKGVKTGDTAPIFTFVMIVIISAGVIAGILIRRRKKGM